MRAALKLPAILADLATTAVLYLFLARRTSLVTALAGALAYALNPAIIYDSLIWGQWDSLVALPMLMATICLIAASPVLATIFLTIAILIKFQAVVLIPIGIVVIQRQFGWRGLGRSALTSVVTATILLLPVIVTGQVRQTMHIYAGLTHSQPWLSSNAFNVWWLVNWLQSGSPETRLKSHDLLLGPVDYKLVALCLYALAVVGIAAALTRARLTVETISLAAAASVLAFFALAPEMHERYLLPALPLLILGIDTRLNRWLLAILSLTVFLNLSWVLRAASGDPSSALQLAATGLLAFVNLAALIWIYVALYRRVVDRPACAHRANVVGASAVLAVAALAGVTILRWYFRDIRG